MKFILETFSRIVLALSFTALLMNVQPAVAQHGGQCACGRPGVPSAFEIDNGAPWLAAAQAEFSKWNNYANVFSWVTGDMVGAARAYEIGLVNRVVAPEDFLTWGSACQLNEAGRKKFFQTYEQRKSTLVAHPVYGYKMSYSRLLEVQARMLAGYVRGETPCYTGFVVR